MNEQTRVFSFFFLLSSFSFSFSSFFDTALLERQRLHDSSTEKRASESYTLNKKEEEKNLSGRRRLASPRFSLPPSLPPPPISFLLPLSLRPITGIIHGQNENISFIPSREAERLVQISNIKFPSRRLGGRHRDQTKDEELFELDRDARLGLRDEFCFHGVVKGEGLSVLGSQVGAVEQLVDGATGAERGGAGGAQDRAARCVEKLPPAVE